MYHGFQHLGRRYNPFSEQTALGYKILLYRGQFLKGNLHAHVAAAYHYSAARLAYFLYIINAGTILDFCNKLGLGLRKGMYKIMYAVKIAPLRDKGAGDKINPLFYSEADVAFVLFA